MVSLLGIALMGNFSSLEGCKLNPRCRQGCYKSSSFLMTWQRVLQQNRKCKKGVDQISDSGNSFDLTICIKMTEVVYQPAPGKLYKEPTITVKVNYCKW